MAKVSETKTPVTFQLLYAAAVSAAFGDGELLKKLIELAGQLAPLFAMCFPAKEAFIEAAKEPTDYQQSRALRIARRQARGLGFGVFQWRERTQVAEAAVNMMFTSGATATEEQLGASYEELTAA